MKKTKEFLLLFIPLIVLTLVAVITFVADNTHLKTFLYNPAFKMAVLGAYFGALILCVAVVLIIALLLRLIKPIRNRKMVYPVSIIVSSVTAFLSLFVNMSNIFGFPVVTYQPNTLINNVTLVSVSVYEIVLALQISFLIAFLAWLIEQLFYLYKKRCKNDVI